ncbi:MAG: SPOR domain-containing protein [Kiritimatiellae bacterium]|nr:SPOR domain-containing protein [Kiritimatiellia bacterium]
MKEGKSIQAVSDAILTDFEKPADQSQEVKDRRANFGRTYREKYGTNGKDFIIAGKLPKETKLFRVQIGAFGSRENAEALAAKARKAGFNAIVKEM